MKKIFISIISIVFAACLALFAFGCGEDEHIEYFTPKELTTSQEIVDGNEFLSGNGFIEYLQGLPSETVERSYFLNITDRDNLDTYLSSIIIYDIHPEENSGTEVKYIARQIGQISLPEYGSGLPKTDKVGSFRYTFSVGLYFKPLPEGHIKTHNFEIKTEKYAKKGIETSYTLEIYEGELLIADGRLTLTVDIPTEALKDFFEKTLI